MIAKFDLVGGFSYDKIDSLIKNLNEEGFSCNYKTSPNVGGSDPLIRANIFLKEPVTPFESVEERVRIQEILQNSDVVEEGFQCFDEHGDPVDYNLIASQVLGGSLSEYSN
jgi:hypothetical protein